MKNESLLRIKDRPEHLPSIEYKYATLLLRYADEKFRSPFKTIQEFVTSPTADKKEKDIKRTARKKAGVTQAMAEFLTEMELANVFRADGTTSGQDAELQAFIKVLRGDRTGFLSSSRVKDFMEKSSWNLTSLRNLNKVSRQIPEVIAIDLSNEKPINTMQHAERYEKEHPEMMDLFRTVQIHPAQEKKPLINIYSGQIVVDRKGNPDYFDNIGKHSFGVGRVAEILAELAKMSESDTFEVVDLGLGHDIGKPSERSRSQAQDAMKPEEYANNPDLVNPYDNNAYVGLEKKLQKERPDIDAEKAVKIARAGEMTGHLSLLKFVSLDSNGNPILNPERSIKDKIVHYADDSVYTAKYDSTKPDAEPTTHILTFDERQRGSAFWDEYKFLFEEGFGFDKNGAVVKVENCADPDPELRHVRTYIEWQKWVAKEIAKEFVETYFPDERVEDPEAFLKTKINAMY
jgi:hypothetical protein